MEKLNGQNSILITVSGTQRDALGEESRIELVTPARYWQKDGIEYILYEETEVSGMQGTTTALKLFSDHVSLVRMGKVQQKQEFWPGVKSFSTYVTPYGRMKMGVLTNKLAVSFNEADGKIGMIDIHYELEIDGEWQSDNTLFISVREEQNIGHQRYVAKSLAESSATGYN